MKRCILFLIILTIFISSLYAQKGLNFGLGGGINSVWLINQNTYGEPELDYISKSGYMGMISCGYKFAENVGVQTEIGYSTQGQKYEGTQYSSFSTRDISLSYLQIPVMLKFISVNKSMRFHFQFGPQLGFLINATQDYKRDGIAVDSIINNSVVGETDIKNRFQKTDILMVMDLGLGFLITNDYFKRFYIKIGLRINYGFTDANSTDWRIEGKDGSYSSSHNFYFGPNIGLNYLLKKKNKE